MSLNPISLLLRGNIAKPPTPAESVTEAASAGHSPFILYIQFRRSKCLCSWLITRRKLGCSQRSTVCFHTGDGAASITEEHHKWHQQDDDQQNSKTVIQASSWCLKWDNIFFVCLHQRKHLWNRLITLLIRKASSLNQVLRRSGRSAVGAEKTVTDFDVFLFEITARRSTIQNVS